MGVTREVAVVVTRVVSESASGGYGAARFQLRQLLVVSSFFVRYPWRRHVDSGALLYCWGCSGVAKEAKALPGGGAPWLPFSKFFGGSSRPPLCSMLYMGGPSPTRQNSSGFG